MYRHNLYFTSESLYDFDGLTIDDAIKKLTELKQEIVKKYQNVSPNLSFELEYEEGDFYLYARERYSPEELKAINFEKQRRMDEIRRKEELTLYETLKQKYG